MYLIQFDCNSFGYQYVQLNMVNRKTDMCPELNMNGNPFRKWNFSYFSFFGLRANCVPIIVFNNLSNASDITSIVSICSFNYICALGHSVKIQLIKRSKPNQHDTFNSLSNWMFSLVNASDTYVTKVMETTHTLTRAHTCAVHIRHKIE